METLSKEAYQVAMSKVFEKSEFKPEIGQEFFVPSFDLGMPTYNKITWDYTDSSLYYLGNRLLCLTEEEALAKGQKMLDALK